MKNNFNKQAVISLIKSGAFDSFDERKRIMAQYIWKTCDKKARLNLQNMATLMKRGMIPDELAFEKIDQKNKVRLKPEFQVSKAKIDVAGAMEFLNDFD